jgi:hypothetical protein
VSQLSERRLSLASSVPSSIFSLAKLNVLTVLAPPSTLLSEEEEDLVETVELLIRRMLSVKEENKEGV